MSSCMQDDNYIGYVNGVPNHRVYVTIELTTDTDKHRLSISGHTGDGSFGQIQMSTEPGEITPGKGITAEQIERLWKIWRRWHLNDMQAGCEHQRAFAAACGVETHALWDTSNGKKPVWHAQGEYGRELTHQTPVVCPICNYSYGSAWLYEEVPAEELAWLRENFKVRES